MKARFFQVLSLWIILAGCGSLDPQQKDTRPVEHGSFTDLLEKYVDEAGLVNYAAFKRDRDALQGYLEMLSDNPPNDQHWNKAEKLAYWINVYNAFTVDLILQHYPVKSIKDIGSTVQVPFVNTPWDIDFIRIGDVRYTLNDVEHKILRKNFKEPRIHFAINCASISCPRLRSEAFVAERIDEQLADQTRAFLRDENRNVISENKLKLSKIFMWFGSDFTKGQSKLEYIDRWVEVTVSSDAEIDYLDYDWSLNDKN